MSQTLLDDAPNRHRGYMNASVQLWGRSGLLSKRVQLARAHGPQFAPCRLYMYRQSDLLNKADIKCCPCFWLGHEVIITSFVRLLGQKSLVTWMSYSGDLARWLLELPRVIDTPWCVTISYSVH